MPPVFQDRLDAGRRLACHPDLAGLKAAEPIVVGIPRGGVVVAHAVAEALHAPLHALVVRKIGHHRDPEVAVGAMGPDGKVRYDAAFFHELKAHERTYARTVSIEREELYRRQKAYGAEGFPDVSGRTILLVDDGIATGATLRSALDWLKSRNPAKIVVAVPCAPADSVRSLRLQGHEVVCLNPDPLFQAVGQYYGRFEPTRDQDVRELLSSAKNRMENARSRRKLR